MAQRPHIFDFTPDALRNQVRALGMPLFVADQVIDWLYQKGVADVDRMTNISVKNRQLLAEHFVFLSGVVVRHQLATDATQKLLIDWSGSLNSPGSTLLPVIGDSDRQTECVMIPTTQRKTACVSSQIGCPVGCRFCASGIGGLDGNLRGGQIIEQVFRMGRLEHVGRITNVVFMGMGEPLANFANVANAIRTLNAPWGFGISARRITVSTVGLPAAIRKLVDFELPVTLALSLHAPNDEIRRQLIPWANYATIEELLDACGEYFSKTGREITLEYLLLREVNDRAEHARELAHLAKRLRANVNLIRYNEVKGMPFDRPTTDDVLRFQKILREHSVNAHLRASRGRDIAAACGQLRHEHRASPHSAGESEVDTASSVTS
jgi:23S rRNA (adenine2503-C2)-methyltransferase